MDQKRSLRWAGRYFLFTTALSLLGVAIVGLGGYLVSSGLVLGPDTIFGFRYPHFTTRSYLGLVPVVLGLAVWRLGKAWALYHTMTGAMAEELGDTFDTEHVKSDIVAVLDDRLADMQQDLQSANRELRELKREDGFEFGSED
ncbi:MAG: hypothetical protein U5K70_00120 [Halodesulfurarchaeum sp.]|nr:hypothetical protein [Halodesulfurarchaeum sp.]